MHCAQPSATLGVIPVGWSAILFAIHHSPRETAATGSVRELHRAMPRILRPRLARPSRLETFPSRNRWLSRRAVPQPRTGCPLRVSRRRKEVAQRTD